MNAKDFNHWLAAMSISAAEASRRLGVHANTITNYRRNGAPDHIALACSALYHRLPPWRE